MPSVHNATARYNEARIDRLPFGIRRTADLRTPGTPDTRAFNDVRSISYVGEFGATVAAAINADISLSLRSADMDILCMRDMFVRPMPVMIIRTEKYTAKIMQVKKHSQNQIERFMWHSIS